MSTITTDVALASLQLSSGKVVAIPTETVYGLAGEAIHSTAIQTIYAMKKRPTNHPLIVHVHKDFDLLDWVSYIPDYAYALIKAFWPGSLTLVLSAKSGKVNPLITGGQDTVAFRCPNHPVTQRLLSALEVPLVAPSANPFGKISPTTAQHVQDSFPTEELLILDGGRCFVGIESTIVLATHPDYYQILRHGGVAQSNLQTIAANCLTNANENVRVPGRLDQHYQPTKPLYYFESIDHLKAFLHRNAGLCIYLMSFQSLSKPFVDLSYQFPADLQQVGFELYYQLRKADASSAECILIEMPSLEPGWESIIERIRKAGRPLATYMENPVDFTP